MNVNLHLFLPEHFFSRKSLSLFTFLILLPNLFGLIVLPNVFGFKIHFFQYFIFIAAILFGPFAGAISGIFGSTYVAMAMGNPFILVGNAILGFFTGFLAKKVGVMKAVAIAYFIQLPWLIFSDIVFAGMPVAIVQNIVISLLFSNLLFGFLALKTFSKIEKAIA